MSAIGNTGLNSQLYWPKEEPVPVSDGKQQQLEQEDFFAMLTEQLSNQDPTKPVENDQLVNQMTAFSTSQGVSDLNKNFESFASSMTSNQALQATGLIGQNVLVQGANGFLDGSGRGLGGVIVNEQTSANTQISIQNANGEVVRVMDVGTLAKGNVEFGWDGTDQNGNRLPPGEYSVQVTGEVLGEGAALNTAIYQQVNSVSMMGAGQGVVLNIAGDNSITLDDVIQIGG